MKSLRLRLTAILALAYLTGLMVTSFHRVAWRQFAAGVRGIWSITGTAPPTTAHEKD